MKKILLILLVMLPLLLGQVIIRQQSVDIIWNAHASMFDSVITYEIVLAPVGDKGNFNIFEETALVTSTVTVASEGDWLVGVRAVRTVNSNGERSLGPINWSNENGVFTPDPFIIRWYAPPDAVENLRLQ